MYGPGYIIPADVTREYLAQLVREQIRIMLREREAREPKWVPQNVVFQHDPNWRKRKLSIQAAHDATTWFWKAGRIVYWTAAASPTIAYLISAL